MKRGIWLIVSALAALGLVLGFAGCDDDDHDGDLTPPQFSIEVGESWFESSFESVDIILHSLDGGEVVQTIRLNKAGVADFGEVYGRKITWSFVRSSHYHGFYSIFTYTAAPAGAWSFKNDFPPYEASPYGSASINLTFPEGYYDKMRINVPLSGYYISFSQSEPLSTYSQLVNPRFFEADTTLSIIASIYSENEELPAYIGWAFDQAFQVNGQNEFNIPLDKTLTPVPISSTRELTTLSVSGDKGAANVSFQIGYSPTAFNGTVYMIEDFPANNYDLYAAYETAELEYNFTLMTVENLPSVLSIPQTDIVYTETDGEITNVGLIRGTADYLYCSWYLETDLDTQRRYSWRVYTNQNASEIARPILPPELVTEIGLEREAMRVSEISLGDWSPLHGYDDYLRLKYINIGSPEESSLAVSSANYFYLTRRNPDTVFELPTDLQRMLDLDKQRCCLDHYDPADQAQFKAISQ